MTLEVFSNLNDSMILFYDSKPLCLLQDRLAVLTSRMLLPLSLRTQKSSSAERSPYT